MPQASEAARLAARGAAKALNPSAGPAYFRPRALESVLSVLARAARLRPIARSDTGLGLLTRSDWYYYSASGNAFQRAPLTPKPSA